MRALACCVLHIICHVVRLSSGILSIVSNVDLNHPATSNQSFSLVHTRIELGSIGDCYCIILTEDNHGNSCHYYIDPYSMELRMNLMSDVCDTLTDTVG